MILNAKENSIFASRYKITNSGCSVARLSRHVWDVEAAGSNPATPTKKAQLKVELFLFILLIIFFMKLLIVMG